MAGFRASPLRLASSYGERSPGTGDWAGVAARLSASRNYWIISSRADGRPHAAPVWGVWLDEAIWFSTDPQSIKGRNLADRPEVVVHLESGDDVVIVEGVAGPAPQARFEAYRAEYKRKYDFDHPDWDAADSAVFSVAPRRIMTWNESEFPASGVSWTPADE
jgi:hypothetical protein